jgi:hypothetical protein
MLIMKMSMSLDGLAIGGAGFMRSLIASGLPIFSNLAIPLYLKLADVKSFPGGIVVHTYRG